MRNADAVAPLTPGCCEPRHACCNNAWDGYCQEKAYWQNFWCKVGTGAFYPTTPCGTHNDCGVALEVQLRHSAAACGCCNQRTAQNANPQR